MDIVWVPIGDVKPDPRNPNKHPKEQIDRLVKLITHHGWRWPIIVSKQDGLIKAGHGRLLAAQQMNLKEVPVSYQDFASDEDAYAFLVSDNGIGSWSELDLAAINTDVGMLGPDFDIELLGLKDFTIEVADKIDPQCHEDEVPEHVEPKSKRGDIYALGSHRLMCGDSTAITDVEALMNGEKADMVFTDPPYGMNLDADYSNMIHKDGRSGNKFKPVIGDDQDFDPGIIFGLFDYVQEIFLFGADYYCQHLPKGGSWIVWDKRESERVGTQMSEQMFGSMFELCWSKQKHKRVIARIMWAGGTGQGESEERKGRNNCLVRFHPTQKAIELCEFFFERWGKPGDKVIDLFGGSGSTLIACEKTNRKCYMSEIDPHYVDVIVQRWMKFTGKMAYLIEDSSGHLKEPVPYAEMDSFRGENMQEESKSTVAKSVGQLEVNIGTSNV